MLHYSHFLCRFTLQSMLKCSQASFVLSASRQCLQKQVRTMSQSIYDFTAKNLKGDEVSLSKYKGKVVLIENVASLWGTTVRDYTQVCHILEHKPPYELNYRMQGYQTSHGITKVPTLFCFVLQKVLTHVNEVVQSDPAFCTLNQWFVGTDTLVVQYLTA